MVSEKKFNLKRILIIIICTVIAFSTISIAATKIVYDNIFDRYDQSQTKIPHELEQTAASRQVHKYNSGKNVLCGYLYNQNQDKSSNGLIVMVTGLNSSCDDYLWQIKSFLDYGWSVFIFDSTGHCQSEGESAIGFPQIIPDLRATIDYIEDNDRFGNEKLVLFGHSRGGYAACCALRYNYDISAIISVSGVNSSMEAVIGSSSKHVGPLAYGNYCNLWLYQSMIFGSELTNINAKEEISNSSVPVLIIHGTNDSIVPIDKFSVISYKNQINSENTEYIICNNPNQDGHINLLFDADGSANDRLMFQINNFLLKNAR